MIVTMTMTLNEASGAFSRLLGTIENRGHRLLGIQGGLPSRDADALQLECEIDCGERSPGTLLAQLRQLYDIDEAEIIRIGHTVITEPVLELAHG